MKISFEQIVSRLEKVKKSRAGVVAQCPAYDVQEPSLSLTETNQDRAEHDPK